MMKYRIREMQKTQYPLLADFLDEAIFLRDVFDNLKERR
ncbi:hypothetical protein DCCM_2852 [Desulfocucumis palustris]|uniref:Uncharacterized protein n=1 Tax=Desulfocucumis palustris TaxID=1898651 RepID=A0A2L2XCA8_9FIRM|nr:hypothetical protein DCCM_2852 [Desulfocucumis palustris]